MNVHIDNVTININNHDILTDILTKLEEIQMTVEELQAALDAAAASITALQAQGEKAKAEIVASVAVLNETVQTLTDELAAAQSGSIPDAVTASLTSVQNALSALGATVQSLDDINPDPVEPV